MIEFEEWFKNQSFYLNMRFIYGDSLFIKDGNEYRVLAVQMAHLAFQCKG